VRRKLVVQSRAKLDVVGHYIYLLGRNADAADRFRQSVKAAQQRIRQDPRGCATLTLPGFEDLELRFCRPSGFDSYLVIFQVTDEGPIVLRVLNSSQDISQALRGAS
jgi:plasmid stabilization system protein ParE